MCIWGLCRVSFLGRMEHQMKKGMEHENENHKAQAGLRM